MEQIIHDDFFLNETNDNKNTEHFLRYNLSKETKETFYKDKLNIALLALTSIFVVCGIINSYTLNMAYPFGHLDLFNPFYIIIIYLKYTSYFIIPIAVYLSNKNARSIVKYLYIVVPIIMMGFFNTYIGITKENYPVLNTNDLTDVEISIYDSVNYFLNKEMITAFFFIENILLLTISILLMVKENVNIKNDLKEFKYLPIYLVITMPLNFFETTVRTFSKGAYNFFKFDNFTVWHFMMIAIVICSVAFFYYKFSNNSNEEKLTLLRSLCILMFLHYFMKDSMSIGDGYNVYNTVFSTVPFFICDIGKFAVLLALILNKKTLYSISFFVHAAGAVSVFVYFGRTGTTNYGTIFSYSFLYFTLTHTLLFLCCTLPVMYKLTTFKLKDTIIPTAYYFVVMCFALVTAVSVTNYMATLHTTDMQYLPEPFLPNYAFTQINPLPIPVSDALNFKVGTCEVQTIYLILTYLAYVLIFFTFYGFTKLVTLCNNKIINSEFNKNKINKNNNER